MYSIIKSRKLGVNLWRVLIAFLLIVTIFTMAGCQPDEGDEGDEGIVITQEFELVTCYIEHRNETNLYGGITEVDQFLHYGYVDESGKVIFDEMRFGSYLNFQVTDETPKCIIEASRNSKTYTFKLTREMYKNINYSQQ